MVPIVSEESTRGDVAEGDPADPLCRVVHVALALYLLPVVAVVCAIGGASIVLNKAAGLVSRLAGNVPPGVGPGHPPIARPGEARWHPSASRDRRRIRAGR